MRLFLSGWLLAAFCAIPSTAQVAEDPGGWTKAKWGMTAAELKLAFPQAGMYNSRRSGSAFGIPEDEVNGARVHVSFEVDGEAGLRRVTIEPDERSAVDPDLDAPAPTVARIGQILLLAGLKEQYGDPREATTEPSFDETEQVTHEWRWGFAGTSVVLVRESYANPVYQERDRTYLVYEKRMANTGH
jgi:hypothetical protein